MPISCNPFSSSPSFKDFILAAHKAPPEDHLMFDGGSVSSVSKNYRIGDCEKEINKKTWQAFASAVKGAISRKKIDWICERYYTKKTWDQLTNSSDEPLSRVDVERFGVGAYSATVSDLQDAQSWWKSKDLSRCSVEEIKRLYGLAISHGDLVDWEDERKISGSPRQARENFIFDPFKMDQQRCNLFRRIPKLLYWEKEENSKDPNIPKMHPYYSRLSMAITCLFENPDPSKTQDLEFVIPAPGVKEGEIDFYKVYNIISGGGLTAVALVPVSDSSPLQPIISFRCTKQAPWQKDFFKSVLNNGEEKMGKSGYETCQKHGDPLRKLLEDPEFSKGKKIKVLAYSQGGGYGGYSLNDWLCIFWRKIDEFIGFNFIGNDNAETAKEDSVIEGIANQINDLPEDEIPPSFTIHRNIGDWVNGSGQRHIGWGVHHRNSTVRVFEWKIDDFPMPEKDPRDSTQRNLWFNIHGARPMDSNSKYTYDLYQGHTQTDPILDTYKRDPTLEDIRRKFGHEVIHRIGSIIYKLIDFIARIFGIEFLKKYTS